MRADHNRIRAYLGGNNGNHNSAGSHYGDMRPRRSATDEPVNSETPRANESQFDQRLANVLDRYLRRLEEGIPIEIGELISQYPEYEQALREYLSGLDLLNAGFADISPAATSRVDSPNTERGRLGDYEIIREVGRGGMGVVYEARQISLDRRVALKVLPFASMLDKRQIVRFENEARAAAQLHHSHIVPVYGVGSDRGVHFYAMQFIDGQSVRELIDDRLLQRRLVTRDPATLTDNNSKSLSRFASHQEIDEIVRLGVQAANALHTAHQCGVVHRDIKPSNLMLDSDGDLWVTDFGLASCQTDNHLTRSGDVLGTLHYMSPEQARGESAIADPRSDVYSLGVTLYELLTLRRPFDSDKQAEVIKQIEFGQCKSVRQWNSRVPRDLDNVIAKAMSPLQSDRYQSAKELAEDLQRFVDRKATHAKPPSKARLVSRWATRNRSLVLSAVAALVITCVTLLSATFWLAAEHAELTRKNERANRKLAATESTFEEFGLETAERLRHIPGSESARQALLGELLEHYQTLLAESDDAPSLRADRAVTLTKIANVYRESGELEMAVQGFRTAQNDFRGLQAGALRGAHRTSSDPIALRVHGYTSQLAKCLSNASMVLLELGDLDQARAEARKAITLQEKLVEVRNRVEDQIDLATSYANLGTIEFDQDPRAAVDSMTKAAKIGERARNIATDDEAHVSALETLTAIYGNLSAKLRSTDLIGIAGGALEYGEMAVQISRQLVECDPDRTEFRAILATSCNNLATLRVKDKQLGQATELFRDAVRQLRTTGDDESLIVTLCNLAKVQNAQGNGSDATADYREAIAIQSRLLRDAPANLNYVSRLGGLHNNLAFVWQCNGESRQACTEYEAAIEYQKRAFELAPPDVRAYRDALSRTYFNASQAELAAGRLFRAAELQQLRGNLWPNDAKQLFSVARNIALILGQMPSSDSRHDEWQMTASKTLQEAVMADSDSTIDANQIEKLARILETSSKSSTLGDSGEGV